MAAKRTMLWLLVWRALRLRFQRVSVVFAALMVGATIVTALFAVWFDINTKMSEELRTFGANFTSGRGTVPVCRSRSCRAFSIRRRRGWCMAPVRGCTAWRVPSWKSGDGWRVVRVAAKTGAVLAGHR